MNLSFAINYRFGGLDTRGYHIVNLLLHTCNVLLLAALVRRGLRLPFFHGAFDDAAGVIAFSVALLWAVHPLNTEAVVYVTQRSELMVSLFYLTTLFASRQFLVERRSAWGALAVLAAWAGMACKEVMATAPAMVLLFDRTFVAGSLRAAWQRSRWLYTGIFSSWLLLVCLAGPGPRAASAGFKLGVVATDWWLTQSQMLVMYLRLAFWPWPLSVHYEPPYLTSLTAAWMYVVPVAILVVVSLALLWRRSATGFLLSFALAILAPTLVVPIVTEIAAERRMYLPLAAILTLFVAAVYLVLRHYLTARAARIALFVAAIFIASISGIASAARLQVFSDKLALWQDVVVHTPTNATAHYNVGTILLERGSPQESLTHFHRAIELRPDYARAYHNLGSALNALDRKAEATRAFQRAVELEPRYALGHVKLGLTALQTGNTNEARQHFEKAIQVAPYDAQAHIALANLLIDDGDLESASHHAQSAVDSAPSNADTHNVLGVVLARQQLFTEAIEQFEAAVRIDAASLAAQTNLMGAYAAANRPVESQATAVQALKLARAAGDDAMVERINAFLANLPQGTTPPVETNPNSP